MIWNVCVIFPMIEFPTLESLPWSWRGSQTFVPSPMDGTEGKKWFLTVSGDGHLSASAPWDCSLLGPMRRGD